MLTLNPPSGAAVTAPTALSAADLAELIGAFNDVTGKLQTAHEALRGEVRRLKEELRTANEEIERSRRLAALGEMAAGIAHEVRNPLGSIRLYAGLLEKDLAGRPEECSLAVKILGAVRGLDGVVTDVLSFAREARLRPASTTAGELLDRAIEEALAGEPDGAGVEVRRPDRTRPTVAIVCDATLVHRALVNLIRNAVQAMAGDGADGAGPVGARVLTVDATVRPPRSGGVRGRRAVSLLVRDSGPGVPADVMKRMFNPFFTTRATGTGLGLAIVHRIAEAHGGRVTVKNHAKGGAVVELALPGDPAEAAAVQGAARADGAGCEDEGGPVGVVRSAGAGVSTE